MRSHGLPLLLAVAFLASGESVSKKPPYTSWSDYSGSADSMQYSALKQIDKSNVSRLTQAWFYAAPGPSGRFSFNPLIVDGVMYVVGKDSDIVALDAATGKQIWSHPVEGNPTNRGFNYWESKDRSDRRLIFAANGYLQEINVKTGVTVPSFGNDGRVDLRVGLGRDPKTITEIQSGTPGRVFENLHHSRFGYGRNVRLASRRPARLRCADRQAGLAVSHGSASRRVRLRHVAQGCLEVCRRHQYLGRNLD